MAINLNAVRDIAAGETLLATVIGIDLATAPAEPTLYTVPGGLEVVITKAVVRVTAAAAVVGTATAGIGANANEDDLLAARGLTGLLAVDDNYLITGETKQIVAGPGTAIKFGIDSAITSGTLTVSVDLFGYTLGSPLFVFDALPAQISGPERTAGTETALRSFAPEDVATMVGIHGAAPTTPGWELVASIYQAAGATLTVDVPANTLSVDGEHLVIEVIFRTLNASLKTINLKLGGVVLMARVNASVRESVFTAKIQRKGASSQLALTQNVDFVVSGQDAALFTIHTTPALTMSSILAVLVDDNIAGIYVSSIKVWKVGV